MIVNFAGFLAIAVVLIITPGPDTALTIRNTLRSARRGGILTAAGVATGQATGAVAASAGVAALLQVLGPAYLLIKLVGGAYLVFLGARSLISALRRGNSEGAATPPSAPQSRASTSFLQGIALAALGLRVAVDGVR